MDNTSGNDQLPGHFQAAGNDQKDSKPQESILHNTQQLTARLSISLPGQHNSLVATEKPLTEIAAFTVRGPDMKTVITLDMALY